MGCCIRDTAVLAVRKQYSQAREPQGLCRVTFPVSRTDGEWRPGLC